MSRIDDLLRMADAISNRSDSIASSMDESNTLISRIISLNSQITAADSEIDAMTELLNKNNVCINEFEKLHERSYFLDSNLHLNESFTNETSFLNLNKEYNYMLDTFRHHNQRFLSHEEPVQQNHVPNKELKNMLSISNLNLRPLRCRNQKVEKKKSRYRLSAAYTLNPLSENEEAIRNISKSSAGTYDHQDSIMDMQHDTTGISSSSETHDYDFYGGSASESPTFKRLNPVDMNKLDLDIDSLSHCSGLSGSPVSPKFDLDNFDDFLRPSRVDVSKAFPAPLKKSSSHDSIFSEKEKTFKPSFKFHNPAATIINKGNVSQPTVETIFTSTVEDKPQQGPSRSFKDHSKNILHQLKPDDSPIKKQQPVTPKRSNINIFNLLNSPLGSPRGFSNQAPAHNTARRGSIDQFGKSLTSSFLHLIHNNPSPSKTQAPAAPTVNHESPPEGIKKLRKGLRDPISIPNDIKSRRLPPGENSFRSGSHSSLTIGNNKANIVQGRGLSKRPMNGPSNQQSFRQVLSESLLF
ncbi:uncharacterized protein CXQ87_003554 [Candidozyma duobushaemuli]|uniref:Uncharacterized protein n=2 Tax=Candidozyma TaxID=3303203 RepID=A0ABX8IAK2_9ASCO|nr:uncharacterized protein CXQ87_003554 [[Candida] duobushaemulonis]PVH15708.1 hypothetical protein CXQ87_003554 [[Candida] duobushaemulonis]QWU88893.1 hypothetical protein CA3LBN_003201 [[Candida] haemuloni]